MAANSKIEWTDHTFNPWSGCTKVAAGCANCYAEVNYSVRMRGVKWGPQGNRVMASGAMWKEPLKWDRAAAKAGVRARVFCASLADVFEEWDGPMLDAQGDVALDRDQAVITMDDLRAMLFSLIDATPNLDWLLLTKRPENIRRMWVDPPCPFCDRSPCEHLDECSSYAAVCANQSGLQRHRKNVWLLTSIAEQRDADQNIPELLKCRDLAPVLGVSAEPLVGPVEFSDVTHRSDCVTQLGKPAMAGIDWVIVGGESGHHARPMHPDWARSLRDQCAAAGVPFFFKQWGEWGAVHHPPGGPADSALNSSDCRYGEWHGVGEPFIESCLCGSGHGTVVRVGKKSAGRLLDGREHNDMPLVRVQGSGVGVQAEGDR